MSVKNDLCVFQLLSSETGVRCEPFTMTVGKLYSHLEAMEHKDEILGDYVLVIMELGNVDPTVNDYKQFADQGVFSKRPLITVGKFLELNREGNNNE